MGMKSCWGRTKSGLAPVPDQWHMLHDVIQHPFSLGRVLVRSQSKRSVSKLQLEHARPSFNAGSRQVGQLSHCTPVLQLSKGGLLVRTLYL